ncbi:MAG: GH92 family glycosyl hydrolase [Acidobacteriaceae bacterium]|nr:GH92 family glycosyl hydrolase [Acidobacteriaceae bacterium]
MKITNRRDFLKAAGKGAATVAIAGTMASADTEAEQGVSDARKVSSIAAMAAETRTRASGKLVDLVNVLQGTNSSPLFSRGNTLPLIAMPFGMAHWTLQTREDGGAWFFNASDQRLEGVRCTHQLSPWLADYGQAAFLPFINEPPSLLPADRASSYRVETSVIRPGYLRLDLLRYRCQLEMVPTERCSILRLTFRESGPAGLVIDLPGDDAHLEREHSGNSVIRGLTRANSGGVPEGFASYYLIQIDRPIAGFEVKQLPHRRIGVVRFQAEANRPIDVRIATSFISSDQAMRNLELELGTKPFEAMHRSSEEVWERELGRILIEGATPAQQRTFYSSLYRSFLFPRMWHEMDDSGKPIHFSPYTGKVTPGVMYADHGYWDVYRVWYPLMSILNPERLGEVLQAWVNASKEGGWLPQFPSPGYRAAMTGSLLDAVFGDAASKGIQGYDLEAAYQALKRHATEPGDPDKGYGRRGIEFYLKLGYIPADKIHQAVTETMDAAYGDFCIAQVARAAGHEADAVMFEKRSENWRNVYDAKTRFPRGRKADGSWLTPFNPIAWGSPYVEGSAWQHRFAVPHNAAGLIEAMGGKKTFVKDMEEMLTMPAVFDVGYYNYELQEMAEMAAADFGQYAHSNQPVHLFLPMFAAAGRPDLMQYWTRRVLDKLYTADDFPGDEDTGSMAAWYVMGALGFLSACPGKASYVLSAPLFNRAIINLPNGRKTILEAVNHGSRNVYSDRPNVNGKPHGEDFISHKAIMEGSRLVFSMKAALLG